MKPVVLRIAPLVFLSVLVLPPSAPAADYYDLQAERTARNIAAVQDYQGTLEQKGLFGDATVVSEVAFRRPHEFRVRVTAPAELAGTAMSYHDNELLVWWPKQEIGLRLAGFIAPSSATEAARVKAAYAANLENYLYGLGPVRDVAGLPTVQVDQRALGAGQLVQSSLTRVYDDYSFPLAGNASFRGGAKLEYAWKTIGFNQHARALPPVPQLPASALVVTWDLGWPDRAAADAAARVPKARPMPEALAGLKRTKLIVHPESLSAIAGWYRDADEYLFVAASRDTGFNAFSREYGLEVPLGGGRARLVITPLNSLWQFRHDGVVYDVLTNLHPEVAYRTLAMHFAPAAAPAGKR